MKQTELLMQLPTILNDTTQQKLWEAGISGETHQDSVSSAITARRRMLTRHRGYNNHISASNYDFLARNVVKRNSFSYILKK